jgi:DNA-directed RNA polymerase specialized sigma24 family protein
MLADGLSYVEAARRLGISQSAVSQRAQAAGLTEEQRARTQATQLLGESLGDSPGNSLGQGAS